MSFEYDVFFSYRHRPLDEEITRKSFNAIESYKLPKSLREQGYEDIHRAFRDTEELPVVRILTETIDNALHSCNCLVVVCSTDTPVSEWIDREVSVFIEIGRADKIYPLLINGDPEHSFPPSLKLVPDIEERIMDIRVPGNDVKKMMAKEETELLKVIAGITGCDEDDLRREHQIRRNKRLITKASGAAAIFLAVAGVSLALMGVARNYRNEATRREEASMSILSELTYTLPGNLTNVPGAYSRIAGILEQNTEDINAILKLSRDKVRAESESAANYEKLATASSVLGTYDRALEAQETAIASYKNLVAKKAPGSDRELASAYNNLGTLYNTAGRYSEAAAAYAEAISLQEKTGDESIQLIRMYQNAGANAVSAGDEKTAIEYFDKCLALIGEPKTLSELQTLGRVQMNYGINLYRTGRYAEAIQHLTASEDSYQKLLSQYDNLQIKAQIVQVQSIRAAVLTDSGDFDQAEQLYAEAIELAEQLAQDEENMTYQRNLAELYNNRAIVFNMKGDYPASDAMYTSAVEIYRKIADKTGAPSDRGLLSTSLINLGENAFKLPDYKRSKEFFNEGLEIYSGTLNDLGDYDRAVYTAWQAYYMLIHERNFSGADKTAEEAYQLQPESSLIRMIYGYTSLYNNNYSNAEKLLVEVGSLGGGQVEMMRRDLEALQRAGLRNDRIPDLLAALDAIS